MAKNHPSKIVPMRTMQVSQRTRRTRIILAVLVCAHIVAAPNARAQDALSEYQVKAAYLFNFLKFVEWPDDSFADSLAPIVIGVVGEDPFGSALPQVTIGKTVQGRDLVIRKYHTGEGVRGAHILFISPSEKKRLPMILSSLRGSSVLTVADTEGFLDAGGMIQFLNENDRVRFAINVEATSRANLKMSSKLLSLAKVVGGNVKQVGN
jgi:YfiR/HmsC-like